ncbi:hypothetical protein H9185_001166 [Listeria monocytogenes]|nr:hypothetical protein [Listeria monocytogenes]
MARFDMDSTEIERLFNAIRNFPGNAEKSINEIFHNDAPPLVSEEIKRLMPVSGRMWKGKPQAAKSAKSLTDETANLSFTVKTTGTYHYLYFPDDGTNTRNHVGNQQFFLRGGENKQSEIVDRCISQIVTDFENST